MKTLYSIHDLVIGILRTFKVKFLVFCSEGAEAMFYENNYRSLEPQI
jgi:hypothetical protein